MMTLIQRPPLINAMSNLIPRSIVSSAQWERKGKLKKKSGANDTFKDRHFVLERDHLYYYKSERTSKSIDYFSFFLCRGQGFHLYNSQ